MKGWIVTTPDIEYNDETYYTPENGGISIPSKVYLSEAMAIKACKKANLKLLANYNISDFGYELSDLTSMDKESLTKELTILGVEDIDLDKGLDDMFKAMGDNIKLEALELFDRVPMSTIAYIKIEGSYHDMAEIHAKEA